MTKQVFHGHPKDGKLRYDYIDRKIEHLRRIGEVTGKDLGTGRNSGACPTWLAREQEARVEAWAKARAEARIKEMRGGSAPDVEWFVGARA